jgi:hypothetical protein
MRHFKRAKKQRRRRSKIALLAVLLIPVGYFFITTPTNDGPWLPVYENLAHIEFDNNVVTIENFRRARYDAQGAVQEIHWGERSVDLEDLGEVWFGISSFAEPGIAHTFLSFDFNDGDPVVVSVEARLKPDQKYHPLAGALDRFHLIYILADEEDVIGVRVFGRPDQVYFYPLTISPEFARKLFMDMVERTNSLHDRPEFYNTFTSNCTNNLLAVTTLPVWRRYLDPRIALPGYSDRVAYEYDVIDTNYPFDVLREAARIDPDELSAGDPNFSTEIRAHYREALLAGR